ncbi:hypothetical protein [Bradyrhizobium sp. LTSP857]|uniref:hypothetical protein n=1 Tax=Bradyrhizobium sp. LTSP857 TaxID=1619231 RepID=UPI0005D24C3F|nr:hypothetical protein [Bradyrhizobium sp. LTSP857]KJC43320.1 hypothetical protein UP06_22270 [Bradyrhizobium sp. LTSP857]
MTDQTKPDWKPLVPILRQVIFANRIYLTEHEQQVLTFIFQRTRMFGKAWEAIPLRHFIGGIWSRDAGNTCSRLRMKANNVIAAYKGLQAKDLIEIRDHPTEASQYRTVEPSEVARHDIIGFINRNQPKLMASILVELRRNKGRLPPAFSKLLEVLPKGHDLHRPKHKTGSGIRPDSLSVSLGTDLSLSRGMQPTNKQIGRLKRRNSNIAPAGAKLTFPTTTKERSKFRIIPLTTAAAQFRKEQSLHLALLEASS